MNDKTLKIRIKLHSTGTPADEPQNADPDEHKQKTTAPPVTESENPKRLPWLAGSMGLAALLLVGVYIFNREESDSSGKSATAAVHEPVGSVQIVKEPSPESPTSNPAMNEDSMAPESQESEAPSSPVKLANSTDLESESPPKQAESDSLDYSSDKTSAKADTVSMSPAAMTEATEPSPTPNPYAALESPVGNQNEIHDALTEDNSAVASGSGDNESALTAKSNSNESGTVALSEVGSESIQIETPTTPSSEVARSQFTRDIKGREPIDHVEKSFHSDGKKLKQLYYFTELRGMKGDSVVHRWEHEGNTVAKVTFNIKGDRWRVYSSKYLPASMKGRWNVMVTDSNGKPLVSESIIYD